MRKPLIASAIAISALTSSAALAAERTVTLAVNNMYCADCPYIEKKSLETVPGVTKVAVSFKDKTATVTYDDSRAVGAGFVDSLARPGGNVTGFMTWRP